MDKANLKIGLLPFLFFAVFAFVNTGRSESISAFAEKNRESVDQAVREVLRATGVPGVSLAIVQDGRIAYLQGYGSAKLDPSTPVQIGMRFSIGSISKQFTATAILMLAEKGKLSLDDPVSRFLPDLTRADEVTIRQLLSHTSGYRDFWPQDYVPPLMLKEVNADTILDLWARKPLDFDPGAQWQYSNTGFVIAGIIVEKAAGVPVLQFLQTHVFEPLQMKSVIDIDTNRLTESDPTGYQRFALGPLRIAPKEGKGWLFAAGELAMTAEDLAKWDIAMCERRFLKPSSYKEMQTDALLKNGVATGYGLGIYVKMRNGHRVLEHGGEVSGFTAENLVFPDDHAAVVVLVNQDASSASSKIADRIVPLLFHDSETARNEEKAFKIFEDLQKEKIDRLLFTDNANFYFSEQALKDFASSLSPLGKPTEFTQTRKSSRGGMTYRRYTVRFPDRTLEIWARYMPDGKLEQYQVHATE